jgi:hypothetical protein
MSKKEIIEEYSANLLNILQHTEDVAHRPVLIKNLVDNLYENIKIEFGKPYAKKLLEHKKEVDEEGERIIELRSKKLRKQVIREIRSWVDAELECDCADEY